MKVLINAISIKEGGSLVVFRSLLKEFVAQRPDISWHVAVNSQVENMPELKLPNVHSHIFHSAERTPLHVKWWYNIVLPKLIKQIDADVLFSQTNYLPEVRLLCPTLLLEQHAGHFSRLFDSKMTERLTFLGKSAWKARKKWVVKSLKRASKVTVQTIALAKAIMDELHISAEKINVIPHGPGLGQTQSEVRELPVGELQIGYVTKFGVQKNFEVLIAAVRILINHGVNVRLNITLDPSLQECQEVLALIDDAGIGQYVLNHGELDADGVRQLYSDLNLFVFPSLCESFGFPMLEAMAFGLPLLVADTESNIEIEGNLTYTFPACDSERLAELLQGLMEPEAYHEASEYVLERVKAFEWEKAAADTLQLLTDLAAHKRRSIH